MHALAMLVGLAAGSTVAPNEYVIDVRVCEGDPEAMPESAWPDAETRRTLAVRDGYVGIVRTNASGRIRGSAPPSGTTDGLAVWHEALVVVTPKRTPAGLVLEVEGVARGPAGKAVTPQAVLPVVPGKTARFTLAERSPADRTWAELTVRPAK